MVKQRKEIKKNHFLSVNAAFQTLRASVTGARTSDPKTGVIYLLFTLAVAAHRPQVLESSPQQDDEETPEESDHGGGEESPPHPLAVHGVTGHVRGVGDDHIHLPNRGRTRFWILDEIDHYCGELLLITVVIFSFFSGEHRASFWRSRQRPTPDDQPCLAGRSAPRVSPCARTLLPPRSPLSPALRFSGEVARKLRLEKRRYVFKRGRTVYIYHDEKHSHDLKPAWPPFPRQSGALWPTDRCLITSRSFGNVLRSDPISSFGAFRADLQVPEGGVSQADARQSVSKPRE